MPEGPYEVDFFDKSTFTYKIVLEANNTIVKEGVREEDLERIPEGEE